MTRKTILSAVGLVIASFAVLTALNYATAKRLYHSLTLFNESVIVENFSNMSDIFETVEIEKTAPEHKFGQAYQPLPKTYLYKGEKRDTENFLEKTSTTALVVIRNNDIMFENYYRGTTESDRRISWSTAKSFLSAIFGVAVAEGHIASLQDPVTQYVPELKGSGYDGVSIKNVLQMSSGVRFDEDYGRFNSDINRFGRTMALGGSFDDFAASLEKEREQGEYLHYVSIDTHVLGMVLRNATGREIADYFNEKLWSQIGAEDSALYIVDSYNEPMVLGGLNLRTRDYARFGKLFLDNGQWNGKQIIPAKWVTESTTPDAPHLKPGKRDSSDINLGYGYQWWIPENADQEFMAIGIYDQYIYVNQKAGVVIVKNSANINFMDNGFESATETVEVFRSIVATL
ncbi:serine hydrolase domain-containing protein [Alkalimarinus coralli]|uniref:serine hydrolase domain-containing protein n=1 Tax=Alkalimarinus coralli TaxID=2935863 RepID=UPI00202B63D6|nr:serine hydrolase [Alkalimarinus coralli]